MQRDWRPSARRIIGRRGGEGASQARKTDIHIDLDCRARARARSPPLGFFESHAGTESQSMAGSHSDLKCSGDLPHRRTSYDRGLRLALGTALREALGDKRGIARYGSCWPWTRQRLRSLSTSRPAFFVWEGRFNRERVANCRPNWSRIFFARSRKLWEPAAHQRARREFSPMIESCFKGVGRSLRQAIRLKRRLAEHQGQSVSARQIVIVARRRREHRFCSSLAAA